MATLAFQSTMDNFSGLDIDGGWPTRDDPVCDDYFQFVPDPDGQTGNCMFQEVDGRVEGCAFDNEPKYRARVHPSNIHILNNESRVWWGGYRLRIPTDMIEAYQWLRNDTSNGRIIAHASTSLRYNLIHLAGHTTQTSFVLQWVTRISESSGGSTLSYVVPNGFGRWINIVWKLYQRLDNKGSIGLWIDGVKRIERNNFQTGGTWGCSSCTSHLGQYWGQDDGIWPSDPNLRPYVFKLYLDNWRMGYTSTSESEQAGFDMVNPATWGGAGEPPGVNYLDAQELGADVLAITGTVSPSVPMPSKPTGLIFID